TSPQILSVTAPLAPVLNSVSSTTSTSSGASNTLGFLNVFVPVGSGYPVPVNVIAVIHGRNLSYVRTVTFAAQGTPISIGASDISSDGTTINVRVPPYCLTLSGSPPVSSAMVPITVDDGCNAPVMLANAWTYFPTPPIIVNFSPANIVVAIVGQCEVMSATPLTWSVQGQTGFLDSMGCDFNNLLNVQCSKLANATLSQTTMNPPPLYPGANVGTVRWGADCSNCRTGVGTVTGFFKLTIANTTGGITAPSLCLTATCSK
ncbi:MAG: hypothetical protein ACREAC_23025, partial [Blastocatellia bacterium]